MQPLHVAVATRCFSMPLRSAVRRAAETAATAVQFDLRHELKAADLGPTARRQLLHYLGELGLKPAAAVFPTRRALHDQNELDGRLAAIKAAMQFAWDLGIKVLCLRAGRVPDDTQSTERQLLLDVLNDLARHANHVGVTPALTPIREDAATLRNLLASVDAGPIGIDFDPVPLIAAGCTPAATYRELYDRVAHVTVRDSVRDIDGGGLEVPVGRGEAGWDDLLPVLAEAEYTGWLTIVRTTGPDIPGDISRAVTYLHNVRAG